jgi:hypothetical protein
LHWLCALLCCVDVAAGELYDLLDMYEHEAAQQKLYDMKPHQLYMHLALQGEWHNTCDRTAWLLDMPQISGRNSRASRHAGQVSCVMLAACMVCCKYTATCCGK